MRKKYYREDILQKGAEIIRMKGYHNTGINDILETCGIPKGSFYNFFTSKEDFGLQMIEYYGQEQKELIQTYLKDENYSPLQRLKNFYRFLIEFNQNEDFLYGCLINNLCQETAGIYETFGKTLDAQFSLVIQEVSLCIHEAQLGDEVRDDFPAQELAEFIHHNAFGAQARMKSTRNAKPLELFFRLSFDFLEKKN